MRWYHGTSPVTDPSVVPCALIPRGTKKLYLQTWTNIMNSTQLFLWLVQRVEVHFLKHIKASKFKYAEGGHQHVLAEIRSWEYGVLLTHKGRGQRSGHPVQKRRHCTHRDRGVQLPRTINRWWVEVPGPEVYAKVFCMSLAKRDLYKWWRG